MAKDKSKESSLPSSYKDLSLSVLKEDPEVTANHMATLNGIMETRTKLSGHRDTKDIAGSAFNDTDTIMRSQRQSKKKAREQKMFKTGTTAEDPRKVMNPVDEKSGLSGGLNDFVAKGHSRSILRGQYRQLYNIIHPLQKAFSILAETVASPDDYTKKSVKFDITGTEADDKRETMMGELKALAAELVDESGLLDDLVNDLIESYKDGAKYYSIIPVSEALDEIRKNNAQNTKVEMEDFVRDNKAVNKLFKPKDEYNRTDVFDIEMESAEDGNILKGASFKSSTLTAELESVSDGIANLYNNKESAFHYVMEDAVPEDKRNIVDKSFVSGEIAKGIASIVDQISIYDMETIAAVKEAANSELESLSMSHMPEIDMEAIGEAKGTANSKKLGDVLGLAKLSSDPYDLKHKDETEATPGMNLADAYMQHKDNRAIKGSIIRSLKTDDVFPVVYDKVCYGYLYIMDADLSNTLSRFSAEPNDGRAKDNMFSNGTATTFFDTLASTYNGRAQSLALMSGDKLKELNAVRDITEKAIMKKITGKDISFSTDGSLGDMVINLLYTKSIHDRAIKMVFIPPEYMIEYCHERDEEGYPLSLLHSSLFICNVYVALYVTDFVNRVDRANDVRLWDVEVGELASNTAEIVSSFMKEVEGSQMSIADIGSVETIFDKFGTNRSNLYTAKSQGETVFDVNTLPGQDYNQEDLNFDDYAEGVSQATGVPPSAMNNLGEHEYARSIRIQDGAFSVRVLNFQKNPSDQFTKAARLLLFNELIYKINKLEKDNPNHEVNDGDMIVSEQEAAKSKKEVADDVKNDTDNTIEERDKYISMIGAIKKLNATLPPPASIPITNQLEVLSTVNDLTASLVEIFVSRHSVSDDEYDAVVANVRKEIAKEYFGHILNSERLEEIVESSKKTVAMEIAKRKDGEAEEGGDSSSSY
jgi:hypothetical protein